ncbi:zinc finger CCHC domain-containing protein 9-like [Cydia pomonella]|uniref:zinc finger CCHC domain-containing protein 9-like n=1 Tax=Cydia pomonella TaxID=82600 RepID=UPI002ADE5CF2|nr:zinc finger CCHC domain-containing protein 9-like [Cydia pomonella]
MTRFARAKGSKASNERAPEDSTPWEVMKEQLMQSKKEKEEASKRQEAENQRITNYENFLKEQKVSKRKATWCDFPEEVPKKRLLPLKQPTENNLEKTYKDQVNGSVEGTAQGRTKIKNKLTTGKPEPSHINEVNGSAEATIAQEKRKKKKKNKNKLSETAPTQSHQSDAAPPDMAAPQTEKKQKKKNKKKLKGNSNGNVLQSEASNATEHKSSPNKSNAKPNETDNNLKKKKKTKMVNGKPIRRKEINDKSFQLIINTKEVELVRFDGFPIMKKDAERLTELKKSMIQKGIPKSEVQRTMKLERRRAEKALARLKRDVCYNCRKGGHNLSDCPELKSKIPGVDAADGICFKCGSTEHRQFECKVQRDNEFRFATCFICREQGHLARQCPDNPKGLYPNGGSCKLCGDVTHLRKDCPTTQGQREDTSLKLGTLESADNIEDIGHQVKVTNSTESAKKKPKKITF